MTKSPIPSLDAVPSKLGFGVMRLPLRGEKDSDVDFDTAEKLGIYAVRALSLPGKCAPKTAGEIIKTTVFDIIKEVYR